MTLVHTLCGILRRSLFVGALVTLAACSDDKDSDGEGGPNDWNCVPQVCGAAGTTATIDRCTKVATSGATSCEFRYGGTTYECDACGTTECTSAGAEALASCRADSTVDGGTDDAAVVTSCGEAPTVPNTEPPVVNGTGVGAVASYTCSPGYMKSGTDPVCGADMTWSDAPTCTVIVCATPTTPNHAATQTLVNVGIDTGVSSMSYGTVYRWTCDAGYTSGSWSAPKYVYFRCGASGWSSYDSGTMGTYRPLECKLPEWSIATDTVEDVATDLQWQRSVSATTYASLGATPCAGLSLGGSGGFRVPTLAELFDLYSKTTGNPALDPSTFTGLPTSGTYWSSTSVADSAAGVSFAAGTAQTSASPNWAVWCVRAAP